MKIRVHGKVGELHSWSIVTHSIIRAMRKISNPEVFIKSTDNLDCFPDDLKELLLPGYHGYLAKSDADYVDEKGNIIRVKQNAPLPEIEDKNRPYDLEFCYTIPYQYPRRFFPESKCRAIIWNQEASIMSPGWEYYVRAIDYLLPSSKFSYDIFAKNGVPKEKMIIVPHGVDLSIFNPNIPPFQLQTKKKVKFLHNAIPHHRKFHERVIKGFVETFTGDDDVCLVLKTKLKAPDEDKPFEVDIRKILTECMSKKKNPPEIEVINDKFIENIGSLYTACDVILSMSSTEGFGMPLLECLACEKLVIAPRYSGQLDFLNDDNSLLVDTKEMDAPSSHQYWGNMKGSKVGDPSIEHYKELLKHAYENLEKETERIRLSARETAKQFSWEKAAQIILDIPIPSTSKRLYNKRKVLYIIPYKMIGGAEIWVKQAIKKLDKTIYEPHVALISGTEEKFEKELKELGVIIEDLSNSGRDKALKCLIEAENYSVVHFYNSFGVYKALEEAWKQGFRCRIIETVHSDLSWNDSMNKVSKRGEHVAAINAVSNEMGRKLLKNGNNNTVVLPQMIDWDRFNVERSKEILEELNIKTDFVIGFVGRLSPEKNVPLILECAKQIDASFVIVGDGPQRKVLEQLSGDNVYFVGERDDVEKFYGAFDLLLLPSLMEGVPLVILEALTAGTPVVASDVGAIKEIVFDGITGSLIWNPKNVALFVREINRFKNKLFWKKCSINCKTISLAFKERSNTYDINYFYSLLFKG